ncbi:ATP-binding protein [Pectobacterium actinidiae]|uniref:ATP-binding protein n=1 Tax=Pectobacterium actinidiae TaxID=1507808 RepID=UPI003802BE6A
MAGQLAAVLLVGLFVAHLLAILALRFNAEVLNPVARDRVIERVAITSKMIEISDAEDVPVVIETMSSESARFWLDDIPPQARTAMSDEERRILRSLAAKRPHMPSESTWVALQRPRSGFLGAHDVQLGLSFLTLETAVQLANGHWLHGRHQPLASHQWWHLIRFSLPTSTLPVLAIALIFVYRTLRPIKALAQAAERVSRGERVDPLPLTGSTEAREVSAAFNLMQEKLTSFIDDRTQLLAAISHDFRTPITSLRLRVELIEDPHQRKAMTQTLDEMRVMVEQTLNFAHDDAATEKTQCIDMQALLNEVANEYLGLGRRVVLSPGPCVHYRGRPVSLKRALGNLLDNAIRHGGFARIRLTVEARRGNEIRVEVDDEGPGIDPQFLARVFEPFFQVDQARGHRAGGVGLGLSIARSCVRAHGGDITLSNRPEGGLRAVVCLPGGREDC